jgi:hypothetical protein
VQPVVTGVNPEWKLIYRFIYTGDGQFMESADYRLQTSLAGAVSSATTAGAVSFAPSGDVASTTVQGAIEELDTEKSATSHTHSDATTSVAGFLSATDKTKLDGVASGATAYTDTLARTAVIASSISDGDTTHAPDGNSVFDALAAKAPNILTGYTSGAGTVAATDSVLQAIQKLNGNIEQIGFAYGVRWNTANSSPSLTKGIVLNGVFIENTYTSYPVQSKMKRCVKDAAGTKLYNLLSSNSIYKENVTTPLRSGTATSTSAGKLVDSAANFSTAGVAIGHWVHNTTTNIATQVTAVDSATQLTVKLDRFVSGNAYSIGTANPQVDGAIMVEVPATHYIMTTDGNYKYFLISENEFSLIRSDSSVVPSMLHPWFMEGGVYRPYQYWGAFESVWYDADGGGYKNYDSTTVTATGDKAVSVPGFLPLTYQTRPEIRTRHTAFGSNYHTVSYYADEFMGLLYMTEYATMNSQVAIPGYTETTWVWGNVRTTGRTMHLGNSSGTIAGVSGFDPGTFNIANSYRGIENFYGHVWKWVDGINFNNQRIYINNNPATWADDTATNYTDTTLSIPNVAGVEQSNFHNGLLLPSAASGADTSTYVTDSVWAAAGWMTLLCGGALNVGAAAGVFSRAASYAGSYRHASFGYRSSGY